MRHLFQPRVLNWAIIAALASALACYPRLSFWLNRSAPVWYLEGTIFLCGIVLWGFVFAWHTPYTLRPVFILKADLRHWFAMVLFSLAINQLFLLFAPFDWLMRLFKNRWVATNLTVLFGVLVLALKIQSLPTQLPPWLFAAILTGKIVMGFLAVSFYLRGGVMLIWWWTLLFEARLLLNMNA
jgi:hypothetical protein